MDIYRNINKYMQSVEFETDLDRFSLLLGLDFQQRVPGVCLGSHSRQMRIRTKLAWVIGKCGYDLSQACIKGASLGVFFKNPKIVFLFAFGFGAFRASQILLLAQEIFLPQPSFSLL